MNKIILFVCTILMCGQLQAQQTPQYSLYMFNPALQNPAAAGMENTLMASGVYRNQWTNLSGAPVTQAINVQMPIGMIKSGIGLQFENESIGSNKKTEISLAYNYQLELNRKTKLSVGLSGGIMQHTLAGAELRTPDGAYDIEQNVIVHNDNLLSAGTMTTSLPNLSAGVYLQSEKLRAGLGMLNLHQAYAKFENLSLQLRRNYYLSAAYLLGISRILTLEPSILVKSDIVQTQVEVSVLLSYKEKFYLGATYRGLTANSQDAVVGIGAFQLNENWKLAYAYDATLSRLSTVSNGTHEVMLIYNLGRSIGQGVLPPVIYNTRY